MPFLTTVIKYLTGNFRGRVHSIQVHEGRFDNGRVRQLVRSLPQLNRERLMAVLHLFLLFLQSMTPEYEMLLPTFRVRFSFSCKLHWKIYHRYNSVFIW